MRAVQQSRAESGLQGLRFVINQKNWKQSSVSSSISFLHKLSAGPLVGWQTEPASGRGEVILLLPRCFPLLAFYLPPWRGSRSGASLLTPDALLRQRGVNRDWRSDDILYLIWLQSIQTMQRIDNQSCVSADCMISWRRWSIRKPPGTDSKRMQKTDWRPKSSTRKPYRSFVPSILWMCPSSTCVKFLFLSIKHFKLFKSTLHFHIFN